MSGRIQKPRRSKKSEQRDILAQLIEATGFDVMPCSFCADRCLSCKMIEGTDRCGECVRRGRSCTNKGVTVSAGRGFSCIYSVWLC